MGLTDTISYYLNPYRYYYIGIVYAFLFFILLCIIGYYVYTSYFLKQYNNPGTSDIPNAVGDKGETAIMFFHVDWCPHCKTANPIWDQFQSKYENQYVNGYLCKFKKHNLTDDTDDKVKKLTEDYKIEGYPTIKMKKGNDLIDFDAKITSTSLEEFIQNVTQD